MKTFYQRISEKCEKIRIQAKSIEEKGQTDYMPEDFAHLLKDTVGLTNMTRDELFDRGITLGEVIGRKEMVPVRVSCTDEVTSIVFGELLPKRTKGYYLNEREIITQLYVKGMAENLLDKKFVPYKEKVVIAVIHHYDSSTRMLDHDNFEVKPVVDAIASILLIDDSPKYVSYYINHVEDEKTFSEIRIIPERRFGDYYRNNM